MGEILVVLAGGRLSIPRRSRRSGQAACPAADQADQCPSGFTLAALASVVDISTCRRLASFVFATFVVGVTEFVAASLVAETAVVCDAVVPFFIGIESTWSLPALPAVPGPAAVLNGSVNPRPARRSAFLCCCDGP